MDSLISPQSSANDLILNSGPSFLNTEHQPASETPSVEGTPNSGTRPTTGSQTQQPTATSVATEPAVSQTAKTSSYSTIAARTDNTSTSSQEPGEFANKYCIRSTVGKDLRQLNVFKADRAIQQTIGQYVRYDLGSSKSLTITVSSAAQGQRLMKMSTLLSESIKVEVHPSCSQSVGIFNCPVLNYMSEADILENLTNQQVTKVVRVSRESATYRATFGTPNLPPTIRLTTGHTVPVRKAYPLPLRCFLCQQYGHSHKACKSKKTVCTRCGQQTGEGHDSKTCDRPEFCVHCREPHSASSAQCRRYTTEKAILLMYHKDMCASARGKKASSRPTEHRFTAATHSDPTSTRKGTAGS